MLCDHALQAVSAAVDGEPPGDSADPAALADHLDRCADCAAFEATVRQLRTALRFEVVDTVPDIAPTVRQALATTPGPRRPRRVWEWRAVAAAALVGFVLGAAVVGLGRNPDPPAAADIPARVLAAQNDIDSLATRFELHQQGDPTVTRTDFTGRLAYEAPERLALTLSAAGPTSTEPDVHLVVRDGEAWLASRRACAPVPGRVRCPPETSRWTQAVTGREPFSETTAVPLELVAAVDGFALADDPPVLGERRIAGHDAVGVRVDAAQVSAFLDALSPSGALRPVHPTDPVEVWLERDHMVPLALTVRAGDDPARAQWASGRGYTDEAGDTVVDYRVTEADIDGGVGDGAFEPPAGATTPDARHDDGFVTDAAIDAADVVPVPTWLPEDMTPHVSGMLGGPGGTDVGVRTWTDGRAWLKVRATERWDGPRLFGGLGIPVRRIDLGDAGVGYVDATGDRVALHTDDLDVIASGSLGSDELRRVAASLGVVGVAVPGDWPEAATASLADAAEAHSGLLTADDPAGFGSPAVSLHHDGVTQVYAGPGERSFVLVQREAPLPPTSDPRIVGVTVRGQPGRYSAERGELEWSEHGSTFSLRSPTLSLGELLAIAADLHEVDTS